MLCSIRNWNVGNHLRFKPRINVYSTENGVNFGNLNYSFALLGNPHKYKPVDKKRVHILKLTSSEKALMAGPTSSDTESNHAG